MEPKTLRISHLKNNYTLGATELCPPSYNFGKPKMLKILGSTSTLVPNVELVHVQ